MHNQVLHSLNFIKEYCVPSSNECLAAGDPVRPIDLANDAFDPDGGSDDIGPCSKLISMYVSTFSQL